eukprot:g68072.t1
MVGEGGGVFGVVNPFGWRLRNTIFSLFRSDMVLGTSCDAFWAVFVTMSQVFCKVECACGCWIRAFVVLSERGIYERVLGFDV